MTEYGVGSLFAGVGGICLGFQQATYKDNGYKLVWANDIDESASITYTNNFSHPNILGDITAILAQETPENIDLNKKMFTNPIDILTGGFPCQAFSIAGSRRGFADERGNLFWSIIETVKQHEQHFGKKPRVLFLENVRNLVGHDEGKTFKVIKGEIEKLGYTVKHHVLNTMEYSDLPQNRARIYMMCFLNEDDADKFTLFDTIDEKKRTFSKEEREQQVSQILGKTADPKYYYTKEKYPHYFITQQEYDTMPADKKAKTRINLVEDITEHNQFYQIRRGMYIRKNQSNVCPTLTANMGTGGHNVPLILDDQGIRKITPTEAMRLQGFPAGLTYDLPAKKDNRPYPDSGIYKQAGNAVSVPVIQFLATEILKVLTQ